MAPKSSWLDPQCPPPAGREDIGGSLRSLKFSTYRLSKYLQTKTTLEGLGRSFYMLLLLLLLLFFLFFPPSSYMFQRALCIFFRILGQNSHFFTSKTPQNEPRTGRVEDPEGSVMGHQDVKSHRDVVVNVAGPAKGFFEAMKGGVVRNNQTEEIHDVAFFPVFSRAQTKNGEIPRFEAIAKK